MPLAVELDLGDTRAVRRWIGWAALGLLVIAGCDLNPQPDLPASSGVGGAGGGGGLGGAAGLGGGAGGGGVIQGASDSSVDGEANPALDGDASHDADAALDADAAHDAADAGDWPEHVPPAIARAAQRGTTVPPTALLPWLRR